MLFYSVAVYVERYNFIQLFTILLWQKIKQQTYFLIRKGTGYLKAKQKKLTFSPSGCASSAVRWLGCV